MLGITHLFGIYNIIISLDIGLHTAKDYAVYKQMFCPKNRSSQQAKPI